MKPTCHPGKPVLLPRNSANMLASLPLRYAHQESEGLTKVSITFKGTTGQANHHQQHCMRTLVQRALARHTA
jgi:hypothetical protein